MEDNVVSVRLSGGYAYRSNFNHLERLLVALQPLLEMRAPARIELDLSRLVFLGPTALALLVAAIKRVEDEGLLSGGQIHLPSSELTSNYLLRMDVLRNLESVGAVQEPFKRKAAIGFRPCQHFVGDHDYPEVASALTDALVERCRTDSSARGAIRICLDELAENVVHHADTPLGGFAAAQGLRKAPGFEIGIVDLGVGIRSSLTKNPDYAEIEDDLTAISTALQPRVTSTPERNSGIGLVVTELLLRENGGHLIVRSGDGAVEGGLSRAAYRRDITIRGTLVSLRARTDRPLDLGEAYRRLEQDADQERDHDQAG